jgi:hypothetical protein
MLYVSLLSYKLLYLTLKLRSMFRYMAALYSPVSARLRLGALGLPSFSTHLCTCRRPAQRPALFRPGHFDLDASLCRHGSGCPASFRQILSRLHGGGGEALCVRRLRLGQCWYCFCAVRGAEGARCSASCAT